MTRVHANPLIEQAFANEIDLWVHALGGSISQPICEWCGDPAVIRTRTVCCHLHQLWCLGCVRAVVNMALESIAAKAFVACPCCRTALPDQWLEVSAL